MLLQNWGYPSAVSLSFSIKQNPSIYNNPTSKILVFPCLGKNGRCFSSSSLTYKPLPKLLCLHGFGIEDITDVIHNKVLVAAAVSAAVGQLMKPFTSSLFYGNKFNLKTALQAGGFPSTHSPAVVATATALGLERSFADSIFGLAVVYAGLVMYDAQETGVMFVNIPSRTHSLLPSITLWSLLDDKERILTKEDKFTASR